MEVKIKVIDGVLEFKVLHVITEIQCNKIEAGINKQRIVSWCDDHHVSIDTERHLQSICIMKQAVNEVDTNTISETERKMHDFLMFVDNLPEVDSDCKQVNEDSEEIGKKSISTVEDLLADIHDDIIHGAIVIAEVGPFRARWGTLSATTLTKMCELYLEKYGNKN